MDLGGVKDGGVFIYLFIYLHNFCMWHTLENTVKNIQTVQGNLV